MKEIQQWLEKGQDYAQGVALYETYGTSRVVLNVLRRGVSDYTRQKLREELQKLLVSGPRVRIVDSGRVHEKPMRVLQKVDSSPKKGDSPAEHPQRRTWYATRAYAHAQLEVAATEADRCELAKLILETSAQIMASYRAVEVLADVAPELVALDDAGEVRRLLANLRPQRSKLKNRPDRAGDLARVVAQITLLELKLKNRDGDQSELHPRN